MRSFYPVLVLGALTLLLSPAWGQSRDPLVADALLHEGRKAAEAGDWNAACPKIADSYRLDPLAGTAFELAQCEERRGRVATAWLDYRKAAQALAPADPRRAVAESRAVSLEARLAHLTIRLPRDSPVTVTVARDGVEIGPSALGVAVPADPGRHVVVVKEGSRERRYDVDLTDGESKELLAEPPPAIDVPGFLDRTPAITSIGPEAQAQQAFSGEKGSASEARTFGYGVGAVGVASLAVGVVTRVMALNKKSTIDQHCGEAKVCIDQTGIDAVQSAQDLQTASTVTLGVGIGGIATGVLLIALNPRRTPRQALVPALVPGGAAVTLVRRF